MVLRGSNTRPETPLLELRQDLISTAEELKQQNTELHDKSLKLKSLVEELLEGELPRRLANFEVQITKPQSDLSPDLTQAIKLLVNRVDQLEAEVQSLTTHKKEAQSNLKKTLKQLACGGLAGGCARTVVAPIDRVKILMQTGFLLEGGQTTQPTIMQLAKRIFYEEGPKQFWRGNGVNCVRVFPYAAVQFVSYEKYKEMVQGWFGTDQFGMRERLLSGSFAGATAASLTHPLDVMRVRLATQRELKGWGDCIRSIYAESGMRGYYKGYAPTVMSLAPFIAVNFSTFDYLKTNYGGESDNPLRILALGGVAGLTAQTMCYPLDTIRRRMQVKGTHYTSIANAFTTIYQKETIRGFYKGMIPNAIKVVPNNGIRFLAYTYLTKWMGVEKKKKR